MSRGSNKQQASESQTPVHPPRWAERLLEWYCKPALLEDLQGDLNEYFDRNLNAKGARRARLIYIIDVLKFFRLYTVRTPRFSHPFIHWLMLGNYLKTTRRSLMRNPLFSAINVVGLAVSMSVGLLILGMITDIQSYDQFHEKKDRIYRVYSQSQFQGQPSMSLATTSVRAGEIIRESVPGIEDLTILRRGFGGDARIGEAVVPLGGLWADASFFDVFTFPLRQGNPTTALKEPYSLVLTEKSAEKLFGNADALGQTVQLDSTDYTVTGVMEDIPRNSHMRFEVLVSFSTVALQQPDTDGGFLSWESVTMNYVYLLLAENSVPKSIQANLDQISAEENALLPTHTIALHLQPLRGIVLDSLENPIGPNLSKSIIWVLGGLALIVILSACFNYTNLSIARSLRRSREVGIRKVIGALKRQVLGQFIIESVGISLLALLLAFSLFLFLRQQFLGLSPFLQDIFSLKLSLRLIGYFIALAIGVGIAAGFVPALFFSRIRVMQVLKDASGMQLFRHINLRKALIVLQYTFSLMFITATLIGYKQYQGFLSFDLGFQTENVLNIRMQGNASDRLATELSELPAVTEISRSRMVSSLGSIYGTQVKYGTPQDSSLVWLNYIDEHYLPLHEYSIIAGKNLNSKSEQAEETEVIVNQQLLKRFNIGQADPAEALGEQLVVDGDKKLTIVGVVRDFHYGTVVRAIEPLIFRYSSNEPSGYLNVKIASQDISVSMAEIEAAWKKIDPVHPLDAAFYDDQIEQAYSQFIVMVKVIGFLAFLAICIASMGLFGMVVFTTETRLKEVSIRKVLGAGEGNLVYLLGKGFLTLLLVAALIALPLTYLFFDRIVLAKIAYHQPMGWVELLAGTLAVMLIAGLMIGSQTLKVAHTNPAEVLKSE